VDVEHSLIVQLHLKFWYTLFAPPLPVFGLAEIRNGFWRITASEAARFTRSISIQLIAVLASSLYCIQMQKAWYNNSLIKES